MTGATRAERIDGTMERSGSMGAKKRNQGGRSRSPMAKDGVARRDVTWETVRELGLALPETADGKSYGTPALTVRGKAFVRLREDGETIAVKVDFLGRDLLIRTAPETFFITDHYRNYPVVVVRLASIARDTLAGVLEDSWRRAAPTSLAKTLKSR
jgi:hypothetical protein